MKIFVTKNFSLIQGVFGMVCAILFLGMAPSVQAASLTPTEINAITNLLQAFGADPATVTSVQSILEGTTTPATITVSPPSISSGASIPSINGCSIIPEDLQIGSSGEDVSKLQSFLSKDGNIYPQGLVTGYFGQDTQEAVQRWQMLQGIVATGTPQSTGYGVVGPRTRSEINKEMEMECEGGDSNSSIASSTVSREGESTQVSPTVSQTDGSNISSTTSGDSNSNQNSSDN